MIKPKTTGKIAQQAGHKCTKPRNIHRNLLIISCVLASLTGLALWAIPDRKADTGKIIVYKSPACGCCQKWIDHLRDAGFNVTARNHKDIGNIKLSYSVKSELQSCHTAIVEGYVIEGHVPAGDIKRLLQERPRVAGLTVPGMPMGSPGMEGQQRDPYDVLTFEKDGRTKVYARY